MTLFRLFGLLNRTQRNTFLASFLGWMLDAFDYFMVTLVTVNISKDLSVALPNVAFAVTVTLLFRPVGALLFGILADRFGRRIPLMVDIIFYSVIELLTAFSPNFIIFLILRGVFGIAMGGEWGLGSSLAMESLPTETRGLFSGILQQGYACGYLLATIVFYIVFTFFPAIGWRGMFIIGAIPAFLVVFIRFGVRESAVWEHQQELHRERGTNVWSGMGRAIRSHGLVFIYLIILMTAFNSLSHGTQDNLTSFLRAQLKLGVASTTIVNVFANIGAIIGGTLFGFYSQRWGRRRAIIIACIIGLFMIPLWSGLIHIPAITLLASITIGAFLLQFMVQGAWGVIPVHLNELSPTDVRGTFPGFAYQLGNFFAAYIVYLEALLAQNLGSAKSPNYAVALAVFSLGAFLAVIILTALGREAKGIEFTQADEQEAGVVEVRAAGEVSN
jgi:MFS transporter, SHS family, lactate transporter